MIGVMPICVRPGKVKGQVAFCSMIPMQPKSRISLLFPRSHDADLNLNRYTIFTSVLDGPLNPYSNFDFYTI